MACHCFQVAFLINAAVWKKKYTSGFAKSCFHKLEGAKIRITLPNLQNYTFTPITQNQLYT